MIRFERHSIRFAEAWFDEPVTSPQPDVLLVRHSSKHPDSGSSSVKYSLRTDLKLPTSALWETVKPDCRRKIRRAEESSFDVDGPQRPGSVAEVDDFVEFYNRFAATKGIGGTTTEYLRSIAGQDRLWLSTVSRGEERLVQHAYIISGVTVRFLLGGSQFRDVDSARQKQSALANRLLFWSEVLAFKDSRFEAFDWGGIFPDETVAGVKGVNDFKRQFGGEPVEYYEAIRGLSLKGNLYLRLHPAFDKARSMSRNLAQWRSLLATRARRRASIAAPAGAP